MSEARVPAVVPGDYVSVGCWCEAELVTVQVAELRRGLTASCGRPDCHMLDPPPAVDRI